WASSWASPLPVPRFVASGTNLTPARRLVHRLERGRVRQLVAPGGEAQRHRLSRVVRALEVRSIQVLVRAELPGTVLGDKVGVLARGPDPDVLGGAAVGRRDVALVQVGA